MLVLVSTMYITPLVLAPYADLSSLVLLLLIVLDGALFPELIAVSARPVISMKSGVRRLARRAGGCLSCCGGVACSEAQCGAEEERQLRTELSTIVEEWKQRGKVGGDDTYTDFYHSPERRGALIERIKVALHSRIGLSKVSMVKEVALFSWPERRFIAYFDWQ